MKIQQLNTTYNFFHDTHTTQTGLYNIDNKTHHTHTTRILYNAFIQHADTRKSKK